MPAHILNLPQIGLCEKVLLAHIYSFGSGGSSQSSETMGKIFMVCPRTIERWLTAMREFIFVRNGKGYYRTIWAKSQPDSKRGRNVGNLRQDCRSSPDRNGIQIQENFRTTINNAITETNTGTTASPLPLPASGQALAPCPRSAAMLRHRKRTAREQMQRFKSHFGWPKKQVLLTPEQFKQRRAKQLAALRAGISPADARQNQKTPRNRQTWNRNE